MDTLVLERNDRTFMVTDAHILKSLEDASELSPEFASKGDWDVDVSSANPYLKWITGRYAESGKPNQNKQFWTAGDLAMGEYSIRWAPLNMIHKVRQPIGFFVATKKVFAQEAETAGEVEQDFHIEALSGMWSHIFPFESALIDQADSQGKLFYSMECVGTHIVCAGDEGCGKTFEYAKKGTHCKHLKDRASIRHLVNPTFRGGAIIVPPVTPGWKGAGAKVYEGAVMQEAAKYAEAAESAYRSLARDGVDMSASEWEYLMATIVASSQ